MRWFTLAILSLIVGAGYASADELPESLIGHWRGSVAAGDGDFGILIELDISPDTFVRTGYPPWDERAKIDSIVVVGDHVTLTVSEHVRNDFEVDGEPLLIV
ncbi:MAG: hypothetical protein KC561_21065, partial [Myxococcales bacterium]|nr:hypothetical protein [Myxococcales bacterium]